MTDDETDDETDDKTDDESDDKKDSDDDASDYFTNNTYFYFKLKCKLDKEISVKEYVFLNKIKNGIEHDIMPSICETNKYIPFNTRYFLSKYLYDAFCSYYYDEFEHF